MSPDDIKDDTMVGVPVPGGEEIRREEGGRKRYASLIVVEGRTIGHEFRLHKLENVIGRDKEANLRILGDKSVSRQHARLQMKFDPATRNVDYVLTDLGSTNRTIVNGEPISLLVLHEGDKIRVGETVLKFVLQDEIDAKFHKEIQRRIHYDNLTGLLTRESFDLALTYEIERSRDGELPLAVLMMDIDFFKKVNDTHGHPTGSAVLAHVGQLIRDNFRAVDVCGRYGGEEFVCYLAEVDGQGAIVAAERFRETFRAHEFFYQENSLRITISIGIAVFPEHGDEVDLLVARADKALYRAKNAGRDRVVLYEQAADE